MHCMSCGTEMINNLVLRGGEHIAYDMCPECGSLWLDAGELDKLAYQVDGSIEFSSQEPAEGAHGQRRPCPRCKGITLDKVSFIGSEDIVLDRCDNCGGFWLDGGGLDLINRELEDIMPVEGHGFSDFVNHAHVPFVQKRIWARSDETDFAVEVPPVRGAERGEPTDQVCPACDGHLERWTAFGTGFEACPDCGGIWLDKDELKDLKDRAEKDPWTDLRWMNNEIEAIEDPTAMLSDRHCPRCDDSRLVSASFGKSPIVIEWCPDCHGVWLDRGEFRQIVDLLKDRLGDLSRDELKERIRDEISDVWKGGGDLGELAEARAAVSALVKMTLFEHPKLVGLLSAFSRAAGSFGA
jgi:Zn-finger nucleic acid-binding protein